MLAGLLAANHSLVVVDVMREASRDLWSDCHGGYAARAWTGSYRKALQSMVAPPSPQLDEERKKSPPAGGLIVHLERLATTPTHDR